jgi:hypothetical protein
VSLKGFVKQPHRASLVAEATPEALIDALEQHKAPASLISLKTALSEFGAGVETS